MRVLGQGERERRTKKAGGCRIREERGRRKTRKERGAFYSNFRMPVLTRIIVKTFITKWLFPNTPLVAPLFFNRHGVVAQLARA